MSAGRAADTAPGTAVTATARPGMIGSSEPQAAPRAAAGARPTITGAAVPGSAAGLTVAAARRWLWRAVLAATGGLTVTGALPRGGCVVVANHSSHADTAALLAAIDARHRPRFVAAADYWSGLRGAVSRALGAAVPVRRTGGGSADLAGCAALLAAGRAVVVYPEGTRGDGAPGLFHTGAFRLAAAADVPAVPVGLAGTAELLPQHGRLRRRPVAVRIGTPVAVGWGGAAPASSARTGDPAAMDTTIPAATIPTATIPAATIRAGTIPAGTHAAATIRAGTIPATTNQASGCSAPPDPAVRPRTAVAPADVTLLTAPSAPALPDSAVAAVARAAVARLAASPAPVADSRWRVQVSRVARGRPGIGVVAAWAFAEAVWWPLVPELILFALLPAAPRTGWRLVPAAVLASMAGGICTLALGAGAPSAPLVTDRMRAEVHAQVATEGAAAVRHQPPSGIPFTVYAAEAGRAGGEPLPFLREATTHRGTRIALVGAGCALLGAAVRRARHLYAAVLVGGVALFAVGFALVVAYWS